MRFSLQDVKKSIQRRGGELSVTLHFLRSGELLPEIERLLGYYEVALGRPQQLFSFDEARACIADYRMANCLIAVLSHWYSWQQRSWLETVQCCGALPELLALGSAVQLRLALYVYVNESHQGFLDEQARENALATFASVYHLTLPDLEMLLALDSDGAALLTRSTPEPPTPQEIAALYNQWAFEAALFNASSVNFTIDCAAFARSSSTQQDALMVGSGVGTVIKRLCYLARQLGVYYDLAYAEDTRQASTLQTTPLLLKLTLYGPQEVTGAPQQYGLRLTRLCRLLLNYTLSGAAKSTRNATTTKKRPTLSSGIVEATATVHFLQRTYSFALDAHLAQLLAMNAQTEHRIEQSPSANTAQLFDSGVEQLFSEAFVALARGNGVDGWQLEREPEPLLLPDSIFIPDFAFTRGERRIYGEILGFWTPAYRERKIHKLQQLRARGDLLLAIPVEARDAFASIAEDFPIVYYTDQLSATDVLHLLRMRYDDFAERLASLDVVEIRAQVKRVGLFGEHECYTLLHCYRRSEILQAAERVSGEEIAFLAGVGLYHRRWMEQVRQTCVAWLRGAQPAPLVAVVEELQRRWPVLQTCAATAIEALLEQWPELLIQRASIFDVTVILKDTTSPASLSTEEIAATEEQVLSPVPGGTKRSREKRSGNKKRAEGTGETRQGNLWDNA